MEENVIIAGDMNLPNVRWEAGVGGNVKQSIVHDIMNEGFTQVVQEGTRETRTGQNNILDVILIRPEELWVNTKVIEGISDHKIPVVCLLTGSGEKEAEKKKVWYYKRAREENVRFAFKQKYTNDWKEKNMPKIQIMWMEFRRIYNDIRQECIPSKVIGINSDPVYYDKKVKSLKRKCRKMHKRKKNTFVQQELNEMRKDLTKAKADAKDRFVSTIFNENDMHGSWNRLYRYVGQQRGNGRTLPVLRDKHGTEWDEDLGKANALNKQYGEVFRQSGKNRYIMDGVLNEDEEVKITEVEVWNALKKIKNGKAPGQDGISNDMIKLAGTEIIPYLVDIFNLSIKEGKLPEEWKEAIVVPIFKGGERCKIQQYRPVSLTSCIGKVMERIIENRIQKIMDMKGGLHDTQHGFRKDFSCETQMLGLYTELAGVLDKGGRVDAVFLDFEKAFDKIDHEILMKKLWDKVGHLEIVNWIGDFLCNRIQKVRVGEVIGDSIKVLSGVPQGSVLAPLLFSIFIDDLGDGVSNSKIRLFADDSVIYKEIEDEADTRKLQDDIETVEEWVRTNGMALNVEKCKVVCFGKGRKTGFEYKIDGKYIEEVNNYKYLGITFHKDLSWKKQIECTTKKGINTLNFVMRQLKGMKKEVKSKAYLTLVRPLMEYGCSVWDPYKKNEIKEVEKVQRLAARRVTGKMKRFQVVENDKGEVERVIERPSEMVKELGWKTLESRRRWISLCNYFRALRGSGGWRALGEQIVMAENKYEYRGGHRRKVELKCMKKDVGHYSFLNRTGKAWNRLEKSVMDGEEDDLKDFKNRLLVLDNII
jgi:hypothetical protein